MKRTYVVEIVSIALLAVLALPTLTLNANAGLFTSPLPLPSNDDFGSATVIAGLPFDEAVDTELATAEEEEPIPSCAYDPAGRTVWYSFTPGNSGALSAYVWDASFSPAVAVHTGDSLASLNEVAAYCGDGALMFYAEAGTTYYLQVRGFYNEGGPLHFHLEVAPPQAEFGFYPGDPSVFNVIQFYSWSYDPGEVGIESQAWDFGDGSGSMEWNSTHRYAADGDYTVQLAVTTYDGRTAATSLVVPVRTHDVAITKFSVPKAASAGQTRSITVGVTSKRYPQNVQVDLFKSVSGGFQWVGTLAQSVPVYPANRTTDFKFSYTFTSDDAIVGKVTFRTVAAVIDAIDALPADNEAISAPAKVSR